MDYQLNSPKKCNVFIFVSQEVHLIGLAGPSQVFWEANQIVADLYTIRYFTHHTSINSAQKLGLQVSLKVEDINPKHNDLIVIPGFSLRSYLDHKIFFPDSLKNWFRSQNKKGIRFFTIGSGTLFLASTGVLDGKYCTSHWKCSEIIKSKFPKVKYVEDKTYIKDQNVISSAGMSSNIDSTIAILEADHGPVFASRIALELLVYLRRLGPESQGNAHLGASQDFHPMVHNTQLIISSNLKRNHTNAELASLVKTSERHLTRLFKHVLGVTITDYKNKLRIEVATHLMANQSLSISQIAAECGYSDTRQLKRVWKKVKNEMLAYQVKNQ